MGWKINGLNACNCSFKLVPPPLWAIAQPLRQAENTSVFGRSLSAPWLELFLLSASFATSLSLDSRGAAAADESKQSSEIKLLFDCTIYKIKQHTIREKLISGSKYRAELRGSIVCDTSLSSLTDYLLDLLKKGNPFLFTLNSAEDQRWNIFCWIDSDLIYGPYCAV